jgi:hypothetical protein
VLGEEEVRDGEEEREGEETSSPKSARAVSRCLLVISLPSTDTTMKGIKLKIVNKLNKFKKPFGSKRATRGTESTWEAREGISGLPRRLISVSLVKVAKTARLLTPLKLNK